MSARYALARRLGILPGYTDATGARHDTTPETRDGLLAAMGFAPASEAEAEEALATLPAPDTLPEWVISEAGSAPVLDIPEGQDWQIFLENGEGDEGTGPELPALPIGRHRLESGGATCWILSAPGSLPLPDRGWGLMVPLWGLRDAATGGIGDYRDLARMAEGAARHGAGFLGINPVHAGFPSDETAFSPYTPSHRRRLSTLHIATGMQRPESGRLIDYYTEIPAQNAALEGVFERAALTGFLPWLAEEGEALTRFATHQALSEIHGPYWNTWPAALQDPESPETRQAAREMAERLRFHAWQQFEAERQLDAAQARARAAGMTQGLYLDLAVGTHPHGAETWEDRASFASGASLGAPPDAFARDGQNWNLAPFNPAHLIATGFQALAETLRRQLRFSGLLRIDHILGFERAFWVPDGAPGAYVQMPREAMLAVARIEAARAGASIVGEDLGNIPEGLGEAMARSGILGCRVSIFEQHWGEDRFRAPGDYTEAAIASFSTHDLPTWTGWRGAREIEARRLIGVTSETDADWLSGERTAEVERFDRLSAGYSDAVPDSAERMHATLAAAASRLVAVQAENVLEVTEQPNLPGTTIQYPNWRQRLPKGPEALAADPRLARTAAILKDHGR
ncbi:4-alpha-glucanotransferase [Litorisediminicola beolgyonensis]|uniref:4-alpha-glucanotransferase n=1 Tax=Litorisediminicola beolgyonensis TaxID=1173614 RepID=A0ABW3ZIC0_9RHOB